MARKWSDLSITADTLDKSVLECQASATFEDMEACFKAFDKDSDGYLTLADFGALCRALFRNDQGKAYTIEEKDLAEMFAVFDINNDRMIGFDEFRFCWRHWIKPIVRPVSALLVVDVQNDFISGTLAICNCEAQHAGEDVLEPINKLLDQVPFDSVFYSLDWHPKNHVSFYENVAQRKLHPSSKKSAGDIGPYDVVVFEGPPVNEQMLWPTHCVQNTWGAELHRDLKVAEGSIFVYKGIHPDIDSYSAFWDNNKISQTSLAEHLKEKKITDVYVCGIAYDVCVGATAKHAMEHGYRTILVDDACRGIVTQRIEATKESLSRNHGLVLHSSQVKAMVEGRDRRPELGYFSAMYLREMLKTNPASFCEPTSPISPREEMIFVS